LPPSRRKQGFAKFSGEIARRCETDGRPVPDIVSFAPQLASKTELACFRRGGSPNSSQNQSPENPCGSQFLGQAAVVFIITHKQEIPLTDQWLISGISFGNQTTS